MPVVRVKGVANPMQFPDDMDIEDIKAFLQRKFAQQAVTGNKPADLAPLKGQARATEQSLAQKAGQGISNALVDSGIISDRFGAQQIGKNVTSIGEFLPVIGDATAGDEFGRALKQGDGVGMALGALGAIPLVGDAAKKVGLGKAIKGINSYGDSVFNVDILKNGESAGAIQYIDDGGAITILRSDVEDAGKGTGTAAYEQLIDKALAEGKTVKSDAIVSPSAAKVYEKLKSKGYNVEKASELFNVRKGETTASRDSRASQRATAPTMMDDYGNRTSKPYRIKGDPVYIIKP
jgi:hypothetical protein